MSSRREPVAGGREVEQTLRVARDEVERDIARYRVGMFSAFVVVTASLHAITAAPTWIPTIMFAVVTSSALLVHRIVARYGARHAVVYALLLFDLMLGPASFAAIAVSRGGL